ncbi:hypothetical protein B0F90DRAFT_1822419 [Multifurca ochricompacta]|uniref:Uncharacterized protein n=1 Tax=Multifurca ochricompacta TaxID=376703 RepID=A0AAD4LYM0_9AGAM|nr:hypothetical protein B0F90DRAFT_1822419 [Multifurca ochricompacta]
MASSQMCENTRNHSENFQLSHFAIGEYCPIKVVCIGAGFYGILAAIHFARKVPNIELTVYEKERRIGGTCSVLNEQGLALWYTLPQYIASRTMIQHDGDGDAEIENTTYLHFMGWDVTEEGGWEEGVKDWGDKAVGIIGNGSSRIQLVIALQSLVKSIVNYTLSKTWIGESFSLRTILELAGCDPGSDNYLYSEKDHEAFRDEKYYKEFRHKIKADLNSVAQTTIRGSDLQKLVGWRTIQGRNEETTRFVPQFAVCCRLLTPGPGYLEALCTKNVSRAARRPFDGDGRLFDGEGWYGMGTVQPFYSIW